ncbi:hypothetical protein P9273_10680 [Mesorhizobium sp. WSM4935]|jgi:hypothetical protein|uniref:hypothetical protein n=1 Tax=Mesorhizobium sp. WSM4935 TaxID=3038547 RepID=UPI000507E9FC|nr:hypothetical protein [Mesorhizobium sp. WSM4935]MDG4875563.1 hypothetical protein [Mesorhizobium sp. WSM4935]CDX27211.1 conserved hypothetical protein [Mesorhizobium sp. SOD10]
MMEEKVREAIVSELERQSESDPSRLRIELDEDRLIANGDIDLLALATAIVGAVAGAP